MMKVLLIIAVMGLMSCNSPSAMDDSGGLLPLAGHTWTYEYSEKENPKTSLFAILESTIAFGRISDATFNSFPCFGRDTVTEIVIKNDGSYECLPMQNFMFIPPPEKIKTGYSWESSEWKCRVVSESEEVKAFDKTYENCVYISYSLSITFSAHIWYKEGVGIVKWQFLRTNPPTTELGHYLLKTYSIK